jgi:hypothetical protein
VPAERHAAPVQPGQIHGAVDENVEGKAGAGPEAEQAHAALDAVLVLEQVDAEQLRGVAHMALELGTGEAAAKEGRHGVDLLRLAGQPDPGE